MILINNFKNILSKRRLLSSIAVTFMENNKKIKCIGNIGDSLLLIAKENNVSLEGTCGGSQACSTCHVYVDKEYVKKLEEIKEDEEDLLDMVDDYRENSRLACAIKVNEEMDGIFLEVPKTSTDLLD
tara:strand:- start:268 stop:648 length:381 start_codon:yes stop_codon:yes gene_type:complete